MTHEQRSQLYILWRAGQSFSMIAEAIGTTRNAVAGHCHRNGLKRKEPACPSVPMATKEVSLDHL